MRLKGITSGPRCHKAPQTGSSLERTLAAMAANLAPEARNGALITTFGETVPQLCPRLNGGCLGGGTGR
jgi:hypothetical protein